MKKACAIFSDAEKEFSLYKMSNKYTEQDVKNVYKVAQDWTAHLIKCAICMGVDLNEEDVWMGLFQPEYMILGC